MDTIFNNLYGVAEGVTYGQNERTDELNERIYSRFFSDSPLEPNFAPRPVATKYALFPIIERKKPVLEQKLDYVDYSMEANFNPGNAKAPVSGIIKKIDVETVLRNQTFALQKDDRSVYVPSSESDLFKVSIVSNPVEQPHPLLFTHHKIESRTHPNLENSSIGSHLFNNHTRTQLRDM